MIDINIKGTGIMRMRLSLTGLVFVLMLQVLISGDQLADAQAQTEGLNTDKGRRPGQHLRAPGRTGPGSYAMESVAVQTGFVFIDSQYMAPPYTLTIEGNELAINGIRLPVGALSRSNQRSVYQRRRGGMPTQRMAGWLKQQLTQDALFIHVNADTAVFVLCHQALPLLETLVSDLSPDKKVHALSTKDPKEISSAHWAALVQGFEGTPELSERITRLGTMLAQHNPAEGTGWESSIPVPIMTAIGFGLSVFALGMLLACRPPFALIRNRKIFQKIYCRQVVYLVGLIVVLNLYDLICTLYAQGCGGLWEMNPFATQMMDVPAMVVCFKVSLTICPAILLIVTRTHRLAQITSWWGGVLYTVLILRWVTYNGMFMY